MDKKNTMPAKVDKQDLFCLYFFDDAEKGTFLNAYQSAVRAGYSETTAKNITCEIFKNNNYRRILERFKEFQAKLQAKNITPEFVLDRLFEIVSFLKHPEKLKTYRANTSDIIRALELCGRYLKIFVDRQEMEHSGGVEIIIKGADCEKCPNKSKGK